MAISKSNLSFWIKNNLNVLFRGKHGTGKTSQITQAFTEHGLKWQYFSTSTMDPWVDFVGIPKEKTDENGVAYLDLVRPKQFQEDQVEAIFFDEYNRGSKKVINAVMELIQFKSINGKKFNNLKIVWAAINPDEGDDKYAVESLDPAHLDRFHIIIDVPYAPSTDYFREKYGKEKADVALTWWKELAKEQQNKISPRRLDYAIDIYLRGGDLKHVLPESAPISKLIIELASGSISAKLEEFFKKNDTAGAKEFLQVENNYAACVNYIKKDAHIPFFIPLVPEEKLVGLMSVSKNVEAFVFDQFSQFEPVIRSLAQSGTSSLAKRADKKLKLIEKQKKLAQLAQELQTSIPNSQAPVFFTATSAQVLESQISTLSSLNNHWGGSNTYLRLARYEKLKISIPEVLTEPVAKLLLRDLTEIALSSNVATLQTKMPNLSGMFNHACKFYILSGTPVPIAANKLQKLKQKLPDLII